MLAYLPNKHTEFYSLDYSGTILPDGIEFVPRKFSIPYRNNWMIEQSDYVITYITHSFGNASKFADIAKRKRESV